MNFRRFLFSAIFLLCLSAIPRARAQQDRSRPDTPPQPAAPETQPAAIETPAGAETEITFTERSPLSAPRSLADRMKLRPADLAPDYDLTTRPFRLYVPAGYDAKKPCALFVYLGYKDSVSTPPEWWPLLDRRQIIFITPECHSDQSTPAIPRWHMVGLALDAAFNCEKRFNIDNHRVYLMSWGLGSLETSMALSDVFTDFIIGLDPENPETIHLPGNRYIPTQMKGPAAHYVSLARQRPLLFIWSDDPPSDDEKTDIVNLKRENFAHIAQISLSLRDDLHYPHLNPAWLENRALPFFETTTSNAAASPAAGQTQPTTRPLATAAPDTNSPSHLLSVAQLYLANGQTDLARLKLQQIIKNFPTDPAAAKAQELLGQMSQ
jgi:hypothetical protein